MFVVEKIQLWWTQRQLQIKQAMNESAAHHSSLTGNLILAHRHRVAQSEAEILANRQRRDAQALEKKSAQLGPTVDVPKDLREQPQNSSPKPPRYLTVPELPIGSFSQAFRDAQDREHERWDQQQALEEQTQQQRYQQWLEQQRQIQQQQEMDHERELLNQAIQAVRHREAAEAARAKQQNSPTVKRQAPDVPSTQDTVPTQPGRPVFPDPTPSTIPDPTRGEPIQPLIGERAPATVRMRRPLPKTNPRIPTPDATPPTTKQMPIYSADASPTIPLSSQ